MDWDWKQWIEIENKIRRLETCFHKCYTKYCHKCFEGSGLKWTGLDQSGRSRGVKLDGPNDLKCTVLSQSGRSKRLKVYGLRKRTVLKSKRGRSKGKWPYDLKYWICTVSRDKSGQSEGMKLDGLKESKWTVPRAKTGRSKGLKLDGPKGWNWTVNLERSL